MTINSSSGNDPTGITSMDSVLLRDYIREVKLTDKLPTDKLHPVLLGLFGEVGSIMATVKKHIREQTAYIGYRRAVEEEFGDTLWYFTALCRRLEIGVDTVFEDVVQEGEYRKFIAASDRLDGPVSYIWSAPSIPKSHTTLLKLGKATAALLGIQGIDERNRDLLRGFLDCYLHALQAARVSFSQVVNTNIDKTCGRFLDPRPEHLPTFDSDFPDEERLPMHFEIKITKRKSGRSYIQWNGVFIGDPLTDNILDKDGYRFHDVFHLAHAAILHWSPTFRGLIKHKRKSEPKIDEAEDGGRAIVVEEGLTAWIFSRVKQLDYLEGQNSVSFNLLKAVQQFVRGYEVQKCPLRLWEQAILQGYEVFRLVRENSGGIVVGDRNNRTLKYKAIGGE